MQEISDAKIEYVAKALCKANGECPDDIDFVTKRENWTLFELDAIDALKAAQEFEAMQ